MARFKYAPVTGTETQNFFYLFDHFIFRALLQGSISVRRPLGSKFTIVPRTLKFGRLNLSMHPFGFQRRHPNDLSAHSKARLHGSGIESADRSADRDAACHLNGILYFVHNSGGSCRACEMILYHKAGQADLLCLFCQSVNGFPSFLNARRRMQMHVIRSFQKLINQIFHGNLLLHQKEASDVSSASFSMYHRIRRYALFKISRWPCTAFRRWAACRAPARWRQSEQPFPR